MFCNQQSVYANKKQIFDLVFYTTLGLLNYISWMMVPRMEEKVPYEK